jgi:hypothetical protein
VTTTPSPQPDPLTEAIRSLVYVSPNGGFELMWRGWLCKGHIGRVNVYGTSHDGRVIQVISGCANATLEDWIQKCRFEADRLARTSWRPYEPVPPELLDLPDEIFVHAYEAYRNTCRTI